LFARRKLKGEKYLDNVMASFQDLYTLFKNGDYAQRMPELTKAVTTVNDMGFLDPAVDILNSYGLIDDRKYNTLKGSIRKRTKESVETAVKGIGSYASGQAYQKAAAFILGIFGVVTLLASGTGITGNVIGNLSNSSFSLIGGGFVLVAVILFFMSSKNI